jgi:hypothetical protein
MDVLHSESCVFVNVKVGVSIACKHECAVEGELERPTSRTARVALVGSMCPTRIREVREHIK